ncbi:hypothetical protein Hanom_Chr16g01472481 [Helianthus anomalus]
MAINDKQTFTIKPKLKPTTKKSSSTPEQKYWKSFKSKPSQTLITVTANPPKTKPITVAINNPPPHRYFLNNTKQSEYAWINKI